MSMIDTVHFKTLLEKDLEALIPQLEELGIHNPQVSEDWIPLPQDSEISESDENVAADRAEDLEERTATLEALEARYNNIMRALSKIDAGTYGVCEISGEEIEFARLEANPSARTCKAHMEEEASL